MPKKTTLNPYFILLHFTLLCIANIEFSYKLKVCGNPVWSMFIGTIFPTAFAHFVSPCHVLVILAIFQTLHQKKDYDSLKAQMMVSII